MSQKRMNERPQRDEVREAVFVRDFRRCRLTNHPHTSPCSPWLTLHHLRKASAGGPYDPHNAVALCSKHNSEIEDWPDWSHRLGLVVRMGETNAEAWQRMYEAGLSSSPEPGSPPNR